MRLLLLIVSVLIAIPFAAHAQTPSDVCQVYSYWTPTKPAPGGSRYILGDLKPTTFDEGITKSFEYADTGFTVSMGVEYRVEDEKPREINISLGVSEKGQTTFKPTDYVIAKANYGKKWGWLSVEKQIIDGDMIYTFVAICSDGKSRKP